LKLTALASALTMLASFSYGATLKVPTVVRYETVGVASSYGPERQGRETSSGELFDWHRLTAAHRTLPFGSIVRVTNLANGRSVQVRINDRGPGWRSRIIDLSDGAARRLHFDGLTRVRLVVLRYGRMTTDYNRLVLYCRQGHSLCGSKLQPGEPATEVPSSDLRYLEVKAPSTLKNQAYGQIRIWGWSEKIDGTNIRAFWTPEAMPSTASPSRDRFPKTLESRTVTADAQLPVTLGAGSSPTSPSKRRGHVSPTASCSTSNRLPSTRANRTSTRLIGPA